jgi:prepilin-type N-terminal cleavage/methylation domain-containing protein
MKQRHFHLDGRKEGFTLIELLIVVMIIALLALLAVANYASVQQQARVEFATDSLVSTLRERQVLARSGFLTGEAGGKQSLQCYAVRMVIGTGGQSGLYTGEADYVSREGDKVDFCREIAGEGAWRKNEIFGDRIIMIGENQEMIYYFKPPFAQILEWQNGIFNRPVSQKIELTVGDVDAPDFNRQVVFDLATGIVKRL